MHGVALLASRLLLFFFFFSSISLPIIPITREDEDVSRWKKKRIEFFGGGGFAISPRSCLTKSGTVSGAKISFLTISSPRSITGEKHFSFVLRKATLLERSLCRLNYDLRFHFIRQLSFLLFPFFEITPSTIHHPLCHCSPSGRIPFTRGDVIFRGTKRWTKW